MYDVIILGGGPAGYVAAKHAGTKGKSVLLVDSGEHGGGLGGVCLNSGCIPTKCMLQAAKVYHDAVHGSNFGVTATEVTFDYAIAKQRTVGIQDKLRKGVQALMKMANAEVLQGRARITSATTIEVDGTAYEGRNLLICTGSRPLIPPIPGIGGNASMLTNETILALESMPEHLCIIGAGVIGTEFACLYSSLGKRVTVIEMLPKICGPLDEDLAKVLQTLLKKRGVTFHLDARVTGVAGSAVTFIDKKGAEQTVEATAILLATGRAVNTDDLGLVAAGVAHSARGIVVDDRARTNVPNVWAAGDVTGRWQLAHFASRQAVVAIENMFGDQQICRESAIPSVVYTAPEIACVGLSEAEAEAQGIAIKTAKFPLSNNGRALAENETQRGFCKMIVGATYNEILGVQMIGPHVSEMIAAGVTAIEAGLRADEMREIVFPHPTVSEAMVDALGMLK